MRILAMEHLRKLLLIRSVPMSSSSKTSRINKPVRQKATRRTSCQTPAKLGGHLLLRKRKSSRRPQQSKSRSTRSTLPGRKLSVTKMKNFTKIKLSKSSSDENL